MDIEGFVDASAVLAGGVYVLVRKGEVVYVGKAKRMLNRLAAHLSVWAAKRKEKIPSWMANKGIYYDAVLICPCHPDRVDALERQMIELYKPRFNTQLKAPGPTKAPFTISVGGRDLAFGNRPSLPLIERRI